MADVRRLSARVTDVWDRQMRGACRVMNGDLSFHPDPERRPSRHTRERRARAVCRECPVVDPGRSHAPAVQEPYGVGGGLTVAERDERLRADARTDDGRRA